MPALTTSQNAAAARRAALPMGSPRIEAVLSAAYDARLPVMLEGATGIGKSQFVEGFARRNQLDCTALDLSLMEPTDLLGLPSQAGGVTHYAPPAILPRSGNGVLMVEELNRAEPYVLQPMLQLLTARRLHGYVLPEGWSIVAAVNPADENYQVQALDPAMKARFLVFQVRADRAAWLAWAGRHGVHTGVLKLVTLHEKAILEVPPRTWTYVSDLLHAVGRKRAKPDERLLRDALGGYLSRTWVETLLALRESWSVVAGLEPQRLLAGFAGDTFARERLLALLSQGRTDLLETLVTSVESTLLDDAEVSALIDRRAFDLHSFERLLHVLPGDLRHRLQEAFGASSFTARLLPVKPEEVLYAYAGSMAERAVARWAAGRAQGHLAWSLATAVECRLRQMTDAALRENRPKIADGLGRFVGQLGARAGAALAQAAADIGLAIGRTSTGAATAP